MVDFNNWVGGIDKQYKPTASKKFKSGIIVNNCDTYDIANPNILVINNTFNTALILFIIIYFVSSNIIIIYQNYKQKGELNSPFINLLSYKFLFSVGIL
jgi:hypothetical protein